MPNGFGGQFSKVLPPIAGSMVSSQGFGGPVGFGGEVEQQRLDELMDAIGETRAMLDVAADSLTQTQIGDISYLLRGAELELEAAQDVHEGWDRMGWPLSYQPDRISAFPGAPGKCKGDGGEEVTPPGGGRRVRCPTISDAIRRPGSRYYIRQRFIDAAHWARCAQWGLWRSLLYARAKEDWDNQDTPSFAPNQPGRGSTVSGPGGLASRGLREDPPTLPPDVQPIGDFGPEPPRPDPGPTPDNDVAAPAPKDASTAAPSALFGKNPWKVAAIFIGLGVAYDYIRKR